MNCTYSVPPLYCLQRLNTSDCHGAPTPVFSYYKPGSRCEIKIWRGCPTTNKFDDEYQCSHHCIARFLYRFHDKPTKNSCHKIFKRSRCTKQTIPVYTYNSKRKRCERALWKGCKTDNKFLEESTCLATCKPNDEDNRFVDALKFLPSEAEKIHSILDAFVNQEELLKDTDVSHTPTTHQTTQIYEQTVTQSISFMPSDTTVERVTSVITDETLQDINVKNTTPLTTPTITDPTTTSTILTTTITKAPLTSTAPTTETISTSTPTTATPTTITPTTATPTTITPTTATPTTITTPTTATTAKILTSTTTTTAALLTTTMATIFSSMTTTTKTATTPTTTTAAKTSTTTAATQSIIHSETTTEITKAETFKTTTNIPPSGTVEEVVVPGADYTED
ncbi:uncharacterized protein [Battus philenor]|uniref:uncharacterized protein n=1 Tax=Battus philenor TaxID=42288 RepID=UPI0035D11F8B